MPALARQAAAFAGMMVVALSLYAFGSRELSVVRVAGGSMYPALQAGDVCIVRKGGAFEPRDIVLFNPPGHSSRVLHRVTSVCPEGIRTQGDANPVPDFEPVPNACVKGPVCAVVPLGSTLESLAARFRR